MTDGDHLGRIEARVEALERLGRQLLAERGTPDAGPVATSCVLLGVSVVALVGAVVGGLGSLGAAYVYHCRARVAG